MIRTLVSSTTELPIGSVLAFNGGYFTSSNNTGFTNVLGNTISDINTYVSKNGFRVCDGSIPNDSSSPVFNSPTKRLPDLTDDRFLKGINSSGTVGGSNIILPHTHSSTVLGHIHGVGNSIMSTHSHYIHLYGRDNSELGQPTQYNPGPVFTFNYEYVSDVSSGDTGSEIDSFNQGTDPWYAGRADVYSGPSNNLSLGGYAGTSGNTGRNGDTGIGMTVNFNAQSVSNIPKYLNIVYITRIK